MSYANGTTHYNLPQTVGTDKRDWFDTNDAFASVDAALNTAYETAASTASNVSALADRVTANEGDIADIKDFDTNIDSRVSALSDSILAVSGDVDNVKQDLTDAICSVIEGSATAAYSHEVGSYFWYNDTLYITTVTINVGDTIVPNTNCDTVTVATELQKGQTVVISAVGNGVKTVGQVLTELKNGLASSGLQLSAKSFIKNGDSILHLNRMDNKSFTYTTASSTAIVISIMDLTECKNVSSDVSTNGFSSSDYTNNIYPNEQIIELHI